MTGPVSSDSDLVYLDTETLGLDRHAPVWEVACIRRNANGEQSSYHAFISHSPDPWRHDMPAQFRDDYERRYVKEDAVTGGAAARRIHAQTEGAHLIGNVPSFDTERLGRLLLRNGYQPKWHYHLIDIENIIVGYLAGQGRLLTPPWSSDELSLAIGVDPGKYDRHTAMGDVLWAMAQWDAVMTA